MNIYLAGKIRKNCWRHNLVSNLRDAVHDFYHHDNVQLVTWPILKNAILGTFNYTGPYFVSCDHGCFHNPNSHGWGESSECGSKLTKSGQDKVVELCKQAIKDSDLIFAWIDCEDAYGTIAEIAYAHALGKKVAIALADDFPELWFVSKLGFSKIYKNATPNDALKDVLKSFGCLEKETSGYIYLMHTKGTSLYKIGRSYDPSKREYQLNTTKSPFEVELLKKIKTRNSVQAETILHNYFASKRKRGEWFDLDPLEVYTLLSLNEEALDKCLINKLYFNEFKATLLKNS